MKALFFILISLMGCSKVKTIVEEPQKDFGQGKEVIIEMGYDRSTAPYDILNAEVDGRNLIIQASYQGCEDHVFELFTDGLILKSLPPKQRFFLKHYPNKDVCEEAREQTLVFDLEKTASPGNTLILLLEGYSEDLRMEF